MTLLEAIALWLSGAVLGAAGMGLALCWFHHRQMPFRWSCPQLGCQAWCRGEHPIDVLDYADRHREAHR